MSYRTLFLPPSSTHVVGCGRQAYVVLHRQGGLQAALPGQGQRPPAVPVVVHEVQPHVPRGQDRAVLPGRARGWPVRTAGLHVQHLVPRPIPIGGGWQELLQ